MAVDVQSFIASKSPKIWVKFDGTNASTTTNQGSLGGGLAYNQSGSAVFRWGAFLASGGGTATGAYSTAFLGNCQLRSTRTDIMNFIKAGDYTANFNVAVNSAAELVASQRQILWEMRTSTSLRATLSYYGTSGGANAGKYRFEAAGGISLISTSTIIETGSKGYFGHIVSIRSNVSGVSMYVNGVLEASTATGNYGFTTSTANFQFGSSSNTNGQNWVGDEFNAYLSADFTEEDIKELVRIAGGSVNHSAALMTASALMLDPVASIPAEDDVSYSAALMTMSAQSGNHIPSWLHTRSFDRPVVFNPATDPRYVFTEISPHFSGSNLWTKDQQTGNSYPTISKISNYLLFKPYIADLNSGEIVKILLKFYPQDMGSASFNIYALTTTWENNTVTYDTRPSETLIQDDNIVYWVANGIPVLIDITESYQYLTSNINYGFAIKLDSSSTAYSFNIPTFPLIEALVYLDVPPTNYSATADVMTASVLMNNATGQPPLDIQFDAGVVTASALMIDSLTSSSEDNLAELLEANVIMREAFAHISENNIPGVLVATGFMNNPSIESEVNLLINADVMSSDALINSPTVVSETNAFIDSDVMTSDALINLPTVVAESSESVNSDVIVMSSDALINSPTVVSETNAFIDSDVMTSDALINSSTVEVLEGIFVDVMKVTLAHLIQPQFPADVFAWNYYKALYTIGTKQVGDPEQSPNEYWSSLVYAGTFTNANYRTIAGAQDRNTALTWHFPCDRSVGVGSALGIINHPQTAGQWTGFETGTRYSRLYNEVSGSASYMPAYSYTGPEYRPQVILNGQNFLFFSGGAQSSVGSIAVATIKGSYYGSNELTIRTSKETQALFSTVNRTIASRESFSNIEVVKDVNYKSGPSIVNNNVLPFTTYADANRDQHDDNFGITNASYTVWDDYSKYVRFTGTDQYRNYGEVKMVDGKIAFYYKNRVTQEEKLFVGKTYIADDVNHHIVLNRTNDGFGKDNKSDKKKKSCLELWVDGNLEIRTYEIDDSYWFNTFTYVGIGWEDAVTENIELAQVKQYIPVAKSEEVFVGTLSDYIYRAARPLTENEIKLLAVTCFGTMPKFPKKITGSAKFNNPIVTTNSTKILRLYWNIEDKQQNGISISSPYDTSTYNVSKQLFNSPGEVLNYDKSSKKFTEKLEVKAVAERWINIYNPQMVQTNSTISTTAWGPGGDGYPYSAEYVGPGNTGEKYLPELIVGNYSIQSGERILLVGQKDPRENGVWVFQGIGTPMTRPNDLIRSVDMIGAVVYIRYGEFANKYFACLNDAVSFTEHYSLGHKVGQTSEFNWKEINYIDEFASSPIELDYWRDDEFEARFIDINNDIDIDKYDVIAFMNYPESFNDIASQISDYDSQYVSAKYKEFIQTLKDAVIDGKSLMINSPKLAHDFGMISNYEDVDQLIDLLDVDAAEDNPFEINQDASLYFNNNRINKYRVTSIVEGLNDVSTYQMTNFINYIPSDSWKNDEYHAKYVLKENGHEVGDEFIISSLPLRKVQAPNEFESYAPNQIRATKLVLVPSNFVSNGEIVTKMSASINSSNINPYADYATTIILKPGDEIDGQTIAGKVFFNCTEDALTMAREDYNIGVVQNISIDDVDENEETILWQYSTSRLDRSRVEDVETNLNYLGQTLPTNAGGGPIVQAPTNESNGTIRSEKDELLPERKSILYPDLEEEVNNVSEIAVYSMTYLGLKWLGGE